MTSRVVITGLGVVAANGVGLENFRSALYEGRSGITFDRRMQDMGAACALGGSPQGVKALGEKFFRPDQMFSMSESMLFASVAALECWQDAGFTMPVLGDQNVDWDTGAIIGTGIGSAEAVAEDLLPKAMACDIRRIPSTVVEKTMMSAPSAKVGGLFGLGGHVTTNSSACSTGNEAMVEAFHAIKAGRVKRMLAGGTESASHFVWAPFDALRILARGYNDRPTEACRPMSATAKGFVASGGAGIMMLESLESAEARGAKIYAEVLAGVTNSGGQRGGGSMTAPNPEGVIRCIRQTVLASGIPASSIDMISGHLTGTMADTLEISNWMQALECAAESFPKVNATKSLVGHALGAAGGIECVAAILQMHHGFIHGSVNCEDLHPKLDAISKSVVQKTIEFDLNVIAKASFGFGDVNSCLLFKRWETNH